MTDGHKVMNTQYFGSNPADIQIRISINPEVGTRIPDHFWFRLDALAEVCTLWVQFSINYIYQLALETAGDVCFWSPVSVTLFVSMIMGKQLTL